MTVQFLTPEWAEALTSAAAQDSAFQAAIAGQQAVFQVTVSDSPAAGDYHMVFQDGTYKVETAPAPGEPDINATLDYATNVAMSRGEFTGQAAALTGRMQVVGNMEKMMGLGKALDLLSVVEKNLSIRY